MYLVDSHCHLDQLDLMPYGGELARAIAAAEEQDVKHMLCVCITLKDFPHMMEVIQSYPQISASVGLHPNEETDVEPMAAKLVALADHSTIVAIGETGLDYYRSEGNVAWQRERFRQHIRAAKEINKPLIIHSRQAKADTLKIMREENAATIGGVMHCFTEDWEMAQKAMELNFYISFSGIVTFKSAQEIQQVASQIPLERLLIETDSPYLAPVPYRGKSNQPAYVRHVAEFLAKLRGIDLEYLAKQTTENFFNLFRVAKRPVDL